MKHGKQDFDNKERKDWVLDHPGQVVATISIMNWTALTEEFISLMEDNKESMAECLTINLL